MEVSMRVFDKPFRDPLFDSGVFFVAGVSAMICSINVHIPWSILAVIGIFFVAKIFASLGNRVLHPNTDLRGSYTHMVFWMIGVTVYYFLVIMEAGAVVSIIAAMVIFTFAYLLWRWTHK